MVESPTQLIVVTRQAYDRVTRKANDRVTRQAYGRVTRQANDRALYVNASTLLIKSLPSETSDAGPAAGGRGCQGQDACQPNQSRGERERAYFSHIFWSLSVLIFLPQFLFKNLLDIFSGSMGQWECLICQICETPHI